jgi:hypothetical protein
MNARQKHQHIKTIQKEMWLLTASVATSVVSAIMSLRMAYKHKSQQNDAEIDERDYFTPQPLSRQRYGY